MVEECVTSSIRVAGNRMPRFSVRAVLAPQLIGLLVFSACIGGPPSDRTGASLLDGRRYDEKANILGVPILERTKRSTRLSGQVVVDRFAALAPLSDANVLLMHRGEVLLRATTNHAGEFAISGRIPDGAYHLVIDDQRFEGMIVVDVKCDETDGLQIIASLKDDPSRGAPEVRTVEIRSSTVAAAFASRLANDECAKMYKMRPFRPDRWRALVGDDRRWHWGRLELGPPDGLSAEVSFDRDGQNPDVKVYYADSVEWAD